jgi:hypothetical protein
MTEYTFSRFAYFDTNIISTLAKDRSTWPNLMDFFRTNDLTMGLSTAQIAELADARNIHPDIVALFMSVPTGILKIWNEIINEEVSSHPKLRANSLLLYPLNAILLEDGGLDKLVSFLTSRKLREARKDQLKHAQLLESRHLQLKRNFPHSKSGKYIKRQADEFARSMALQWLSFEHRRFLKEMQEDITKYNIDVFKSIRLFGYVIFYKYYLGQRDPKKLSDFGDLGHLFYIPYCELAVMERDLCNILTQIKQNHNILENTKIRNIEFLYDWTM